MLPGIEKEGSPFTMIFGLNVICSETILEKVVCPEDGYAHMSGYAGLS